MTGERPCVTDGGGSGDSGSPGESGGVPDGRYVAVLDRFEERDPARGGGEVAVLLLEAGDEVVAERTVPAWRLPEDARRQDAVLELSVRNGFVVSTSYDPEATEQRSSAAQDRFDRLAERPDEDSDGGSDGR